LFTKNKSGASKGEKSAKENEKHKEIASMECQVRTCISYRKFRTYRN
jgi:hypothetical protein